MIVWSLEMCLCRSLTPWTWTRGLLASRHRLSGRWIPWRFSDHAFLLHGGLSQPQPSTTTTRTSHDSLFHYNDVTNPPGYPQRGMDIQLPRDSVWAWSSAAAESRSQSHQLCPTKFIGRFNHYRCFLRTGNIPNMIDLCPVGTSPAALPVLRIFDLVTFYVLSTQPHDCQG
jgi:hypothetical protein